MCTSLCLLTSGGGQKTPENFNNINFSERLWILNSLEKKKAVNFLNGCLEVSL